MPRNQQSVLNRLGVMLFFSGLALSQLYTLYRVVLNNPSVPVNNDVETVEQLSEKLVAYLPERGYIGFIGDTGYGDFQRFQYALAPRILINVDTGLNQDGLAPSGDMRIIRQLPTLVISYFHDKQKLNEKRQSLQLTQLYQISEHLSLFQLDSRQ